VSQSSQRRNEEPPARRVGRPRRAGRPRAGDPTEEILGAASKLIATLGLEGTTMSRLAAAAGLGQSSLYYYFRHRDEVLAALVARANVVPLDLVEAVAASDEPAPVKLYAFVVGDVAALCALPFDINEIHRLAARDRLRFANYWRERERLTRRLSGVVRAGVEAGELRKVHGRRTALTIMANDEGVQNWYRTTPRRGAATIGRELAELTVRGLLADGKVFSAPPIG
jgi:TetR/AcrR family transcriptional regulator